MTTFDDRLAKIEQLEERLDRRRAEVEEHFAARLQQAREQMRLDFVRLLRSAGANDDQVLAALEAFDEGNDEEKLH